MMTAVEILSLLKNCDSQNPMSLSLLAQKTGLGFFALIKITTEMYDSRVINRCQVTRDGITQLMVWPTGVPEKASFKAFSINPKKSVEMVMSELVSEVKKLTYGKQEKPTVDNEKSKARIMLELIAEKRSVTGRELLKASGASAVKPFLKTYFERGLIEASGDYLNKTYRVAPGVSSEQLLEDGRSKSVKASVLLPQLAVSEQLDHVREVPKMVEEEESVIEERIIKRDSSRNRFRLARTSDGTLMLFGLGSEPIELDSDQTNLLVKFVTEGAASHG